MNKEEHRFQYFKQRFPNIIDATIKEGIFRGPQIVLFVRDIEFEVVLNDLEDDNVLLEMKVFPVEKLDR